jgi:hypothetical protein
LKNLLTALDMINKLEKRMNERMNEIQKSNEK